MSERAPLMVLSGTNSRYLAEKICASLGCPLGSMDITHFAGGEFTVSYEESIRDVRVFLVQSAFPDSGNLMELFLMIDAAKHASAKSVVAVVPYFGQTRQDRKDKPRVSVDAKLVADLLSITGIDHLITMDSHAGQIQGFFDTPIGHLYASAVFLPYIQSLQLENLVIATPDIGGLKCTSTFSKYLGVPLVLCSESREKVNEVASMRIIDDVEGRDAVLVGDIADTAGTVTKTANIMLDAGAKSIRIVASHCVMSGPASFRVQESALTGMVFTDSIPYAKKCPKVEQLSIADIFAKTIRRVMSNEPISSQYII